MLQDSQAFSSFSVSDLAAAKVFYGETLGLNITDGQEPGLELRLAGGNTLFLYPKPDHMPATFTILNFRVPDVDMAVQALTERGIRFEQYDGTMQTDAKGIFRGGPDIAWFKDPAGNILSVVSGGVSPS